MSTRSTPAASPGPGPGCPSAEDAVRLTSLLSTMANPVRLRLIYALDVTDELYVCELALALDVSEDPVSFALRLLGAAGLLVSHTDGRVVYNPIAVDFLDPWRDHCLRQLIALNPHHWPYPHHHPTSPISS